MKTFSEINDLLIFLLISWIFWQLQKRSWTKMMIHCQLVAQTGRLWNERTVHPATASTGTVTMILLPTHLTQANAVTYMWSSYILCQYYIFYEVKLKSCGRIFVVTMVVPTPSWETQVMGEHSHIVPLYRTFSDYLFFRFANICICG